MTTNYFLTPHGQRNYQRIRQSAASLLEIAGAFTARSIAENSMVKIDVAHQALALMISGGELTSANHPDCGDDSYRIFTRPKA